MLTATRPGGRCCLGRGMRCRFRGLMHCHVMFRVGGGLVEPAWGGFFWGVLQILGATEGFRTDLRGTVTLAAT